VFGLRVLAGVFVGTAPVLAMDSISTNTVVPWLILAAAMFGEMAERYLFFRAVFAPKMPGLPAFVRVKRRSA
jgi:hypothetical protein